MIRPEVKICGITRPEDAELALSLGADYIGIIVYENSPRAVPLNEVEELLKLIPEGKRVLVDVSTPTDVLAEYRSLPFDHFQIHFDLDIAVATVAAWSGLVGLERLWMAPRVPPQEAYFPQIIMEFAETVLVDSYAKEKYGGTGKLGNWQRFVDWNTLYQHKRWVLAGGLGPETIGEALRVCQPDIVDVNSGVESEPGIKDEARLRALFAEIERTVTAETPDSNADLDD
ncbi:MAG: phosphoribosylanthranilate isomerase [Opitutales bacterium]